MITAAGETRKKTTRDAQIISEALAAMKGELGGSLALRVDISDTLYLASDELPGLLYGVRMYIDGAGQVYLAEHALSNQWYLAGPLFSAWVKS